MIGVRAVSRLLVRLGRALDLDDVRWLCIIILAGALVLQHRQVAAQQERILDGELAQQELETRVASLTRPAAPSMAQGCDPRLSQMATGGIDQPLHVTCENRCSYPVGINVVACW